MLEVRRIPSWEQAETLREQWNRLVLESAGGAIAVPSVYQTYEWNQAWWRAFGDGKELLLIAAFEDNRLAGIAPLMITRRSRPIPSKVVQFIGSSNFASDYCSMILEKGRADIATALLDWLDASPNLWNEMELLSIFEEAPETVVLRERHSRRRFKPELEYLCDAPTWILTSEAENREVAGRKSLKRHFNWFKNQGELTFGHLDSAQAVHARLEDFFEQHIGRRSVTKEPSQFTDPRHREFYRILVDTLAPTGWLRFFAVDLNGKSIAYHCGFELAGKFYWYKPSFDVSLIKKSPGEVLLKCLFEYAIEQGLTEFDFTAGNEGFKYRFSNQVRKLHRFRAFRSWLHYAFYFAETRARALSKGLRIRKKAQAPVPEAETTAQ